MMWLESIWHIWLPLQHWLAIHTGTLNEPGQYYGFWSGFGSDLGELTLLGAIMGMWRAHNCHVRGCWRISKHPVDGTPWKVCRKHHPQTQGRPSAEDVAHDARIANTK
jgi:hypothetical protein